MDDETFETKARVKFKIKMEKKRTTNHTSKMDARDTKKNANFFRTFKKDQIDEKKHLNLAGNTKRNGKKHVAKLIMDAIENHAGPSRIDKKEHKQRKHKFVRKTHPNLVTNAARNQENRTAIPAMDFTANRAGPSRRDIRDHKKPANAPRKDQFDRKKHLNLAKNTDRNQENPAAITTMNHINNHTVPSGRDKIGRKKLPYSSRKKLERKSLFYYDFSRKYLPWRKSNPQIRFLNISEVNADLFNIDRRYSLAHCVAADLRMGKGIAVEFKYRFGRVAALRAQNQRKGGLSIIYDNDRFIYYLVTKTKSYEKPTMETLFRSLFKLRQHIIKNGINKLAIPRIGCGLDRLLWVDVRILLEYLFQDVNIQIVVCSLDN